MYYSKKFNEKEKQLKTQAYKKDIFEPNSMISPFEHYSVGYENGYLDQKFKLNIFQILSKYNLKTPKSIFTPLEYEGYTDGVEARKLYESHKDKSKSKEPKAQNKFPLIKAIKNGETENAITLINDKKEINKSDSYGYTPLMSAIYYDKNDLAKLLIKKGAKLDLQNHNGYTALIFAVEKGNTQIAKRLIDSGANLTLTTKWGSTALHKAQKGNFSEIETLINNKMSSKSKLQLESNNKKEVNHSMNK